MIKINEIFYSIQGESSWVGYPTVFVRTSGCNLRCGYCDTTYAYYSGKAMSREEIIREVLAHETKYVCVTGGEPLLQKEVFELMRELCDLGLNVSCETSGSIDCTNVDPRVKKIIDVKTPDSGAKDTFLPINLPKALLNTSRTEDETSLANTIANSDVNSEFKFVICSEADFDWSEEFAKRHALFSHSNVLYSPAFKRVDEKWLAKKILSARSSARLQLQLHKYIWSPHMRGV